MVFSFIKYSTLPGDGIFDLVTTWNIYLTAKPDFKVKLLLTVINYFLPFQFSFVYKREMQNWWYKTSQTTRL